MVYVYNGTIGTTMVLEYYVLASTMVLTTFGTTWYHVVPRDTRPGTRVLRTYHPKWYTDWSYTCVLRTSMVLWHTMVHVYY
jgi:hypothetical protein